MIAIKTMPIYEKENDRHRQQIIAQTFLDQMKVHDDLPHNFVRDDVDYTLVPCPYKYIVDYFVTTDYGKVVAILECKWYWRDWTDYDWNQPLSIHKLKHLIQWSRVFKCPAFMLIRNRSGLYYLKMEQNVLTKNRVELYGRVDRGNPEDLEPMVFVEERYWDVYKVGQVRQDG